MRWASIWAYGVTFLILRRTWTVRHPKYAPLSPVFHRRKVVVGRPNIRRFRGGTAADGPQANVGGRTRLLRYVQACSRRGGPDRNEGAGQAGRRLAEIAGARG